MPIYTIQTPSGRKMKIEAGDEATAIRGAQEWEAANSTGQSSEPVSYPQLDLEVEQPGQEADAAGGFDYSRAMGNSPLTAGLGHLLDAAGPGPLARGAVEGGLDIVQTANPFSPMRGKDVSSLVSDQIFGPDDDYSGVEQGVRSATRLGSQGLGFGGGMAGMMRGAAKSPPARNAVVGFGRKMLDSYVDSPVRTVIGDTAAGAGAGATVEAYDDSVVDDYVPDSLDPVAKVMAGLLGGAGAGFGTQAAIGVGRSAKNAARGAAGLDAEKNLPGGAYNESTGEFFRSYELDNAAREVQDAATDPTMAAENIRLAQEQLPDYSPMPTSGQLSDDVGLTVAENARRRADNVPFIERDRQVSGQVSQNLDNTTPVDPNTGQPMTGREFTDFAENTQRERVGQARSNLEDVSRQRDEFNLQRQQEAEAFAANAGRGRQADENIDRTVVEERLRPATEESSRRYESVDPNFQSTTVVDDLLDDAREVRRTLGDFNTPDKVIPRGLLARIRSLEPDADFVVDRSGNAYEPAAESTIGELRAAMPELSKTRRAAQAKGNYTLADNIGQLQGSMKRLIAAEAEAGNPEAIRFMEAEDFYRTNVAEPFGAGQPGDPANKLRSDFNRDRQSRSMTPPSQTAGRFVKPNQPEKAQSLLRAGGRAEDVRDKLLADAASTAGVRNSDGTLNAEALVRWRDRWGATLDQVPGLRQEIDGTITAARRGQTANNDFASRIRQAEFEATQAEQNIGVLKNVLGKDPENAIQSALNSGDSERAFQSLVNMTKGDKQARDGLKAAFVDYMKKNVTRTSVQKTEGAVRLVSWNDLENLFNKHEKAMAEVFSPEEMQSLHQMHRVLRSFKMGEIGATTGSQTGERFAQMLQTMEVGAKAYWGILKGGGVMRTIKIALKQLDSGSDGMQQVLSQMWFDPELARHLLTREVSKPGPAYNRKLLDLLVGREGAREYGEAGNTEDAGDDREDEGA